MTVLILLCVYPFYYIIIYSFSNPKLADIHNVFLFPVGFSLYTYLGIFKLNDISSAFVVSLSRAVLGMAITVVCSSFFAFLVTKKEMYFRKIVYRIVVASMYLNAGLIPWYLTMKFYGLKDNFLLYIIPGAVGAFYVILVKVYIEQLPSELEESAKIDGAGILTVFFRILFPISKPIIATIAVYSVVAGWNSWVDNYFLVSNEHLNTLQLLLYTYLTQAELQMASSAKAMNINTNVVQLTSTSIKMCITVIATVPILFAYPFLQRYFVKGIMMGAVKG